MSQKSKQYGRNEYKTIRGIKLYAYLYEGNAQGACTKHQGALGRNKGQKVQTASGVHLPTLGSNAAAHRNGQGFVVDQTD